MEPGQFPCTFFPYQSHLRVLKKGRKERVVELEKPYQSHLRVLKSDECGQRGLFRQRVSIAPSGIEKRMGSVITARHQSYQSHLRVLKSVGEDYFLHKALERVSIAPSGIENAVLRWLNHRRGGVSIAPSGIENSGIVAERSFGLLYQSHLRVLKNGMLVNMYRGIQCINRTFGY